MLEHGLCSNMVSGPRLLAASALVARNIASHRDAYKLALYERLATTEDGPCPRKAKTRFF